MFVRHPLFDEAADAGGGGAPAAAATTHSGQYADGGEGGHAAAWDFRASLDEGGNFKPGWDQGLPAELKEHAGALAKYRNPLELMRGFANAQTLVGQRQQVKPPGPDSKPGEVAAWRRTLGVPESPDGYGLGAPEEMPEGIRWDDAQAREFAGLAHELGLTPAQVQRLVDYDLKQKAGAVEGGQARIAQYIEKGKQELATEWGDRLVLNTARAVQAAQLLDLDPNDPEIANSPKMIKALFAASQLMQEDRLVGADRAGTGMTGEQQAEDIRRNPNNPWHAAYWGRETKERQQQAQQWMDRLRGGKA